MAQTIYALSTAQGRAALAVIRLSGSDALKAADALEGSTQPDRVMRLRRLTHPIDRRLLDQALVVGFSHGASFTGEEMAELHLHGGRASANAVLGALACLDFVREAEPGEFSRRALENGVLDLAQVEAVADLIDAETEAQRAQAVRLMDGAASKAVAAWRELLMEARALMEASIDFSDDEDPDLLEAMAKASVARLIETLQSEIDQSANCIQLREGFEVALVGPPNVGKSTLLNTIARRDVAITSEVAGTTRDVLEIRCDVHGMPITFLDTAGQRETDDPLESVGVRRAQHRAKAAQMRIHVTAPGAERPSEVDPQDLLVLNKCDLGTGPGMPVSAISGIGVEDLLKAVSERFRHRISLSSIASRERHQRALKKAQGHLLASLSTTHELAAEELRLASRQIEHIVGSVDVEDVLGEIFSRFCLGK